MVRSELSARKKTKVVEEPFHEFTGFPPRQVNPPIEETPPEPWKGLPPRGQAQEDQI